MHILPLPVIEQHSAVKIVFGEVNTVLSEKIRDDAVAQLAEVPSENSVIVLRAGAGIGEVGPERIVGGGGHGPRPCCWGR